MAFFGGLPITYLLLGYIRPYNKNYFVVITLGIISFLILVSYLGYSGLEIMRQGFDIMLKKGKFCGN